MSHRSPLLNSASAYYRLAAKADKNGQPRLAEHYRTIADRFVAKDRRNREAIARFR